MKAPIIKAIHPKFLRKFLEAKTQARQHELQLGAWHCGHLAKDDVDELRGTVNERVLETIWAYQTSLKRIASYREFSSVRLSVHRTPTTVCIGKAVVRLGRWKDKKVTRWSRWLALSTAITRLKGNEWNQSTRRLAEQCLLYWEEQHRPQKRRRHGKAR